MAAVWECRPAVGRVMFCLLLAAASCAGGCATYTRVGQAFHHSRSRLHVTLPEGWLRYTPSRRDYVMTRDGLRLEQITIRVRRLGEKLKQTDRVYHAEMLPHEVAELSLGRLDALEGTKDFDVRTIELSEWAGHEGYRAEATFTEPSGLHKRLSIHGAIINGHVCEIIYQAAALQYFDKYVDVFKGVVQSASVEDGG